MTTSIRPSKALQATREAHRQHAQRIHVDPQTNSVFDAARGHFLALEAGGQTLEELEALVDEVHLSLARQRTTAFREQHFPEGQDSVWSGVRAALDALAARGEEAFRSAVERPNGGVVFTAHPTFALSLNTRQALARDAEQPDAASVRVLKAALKADMRDWSNTISLAGEHREAQDVIANAQSAIRSYGREVFAAAQRVSPGTWRSLRPSLPTLASWVGYDLDGRTDIEWWHSFALRLSEKAVQLGRYTDRLRQLAGMQGAPDAIGELASRLDRAGDLSRREAEAFQADLGDPTRLLHAARLVSAPSPDRILDARALTAALSGIIDDSAEDIALELCVLRAEVDALQLGTARIHLRVNAAQVRAVISRDLGLETEDRELGRLALSQLSERAVGSQAVKADFPGIFLERSTARRQIMMCALIQRHIDAGSTIRFLIAEAENPATVMGALYLASQFGIEDHLDISPLFETPEALETGGRFIQRLLEEPGFLAYVRRRGYLSIQLGFSDAGRFIGQVAADMAIERIHNLIIRALAAKDSSLGLLIFNTHGESMGRGAWPGSFQDRFDHVLTPWTRCQAREHGLHLRHEVSVQGGDGFLHFATPGLAEATYAAYCAHLLSDPDPCGTDPFYTDTGFVWDTYRSLRTWHERLFDNPDYGRLLSDFATNFLVRAGSRQKRRSGGPTGPRALRAISHNATLQQLGVPVNTAADLGSAIRRETERLIALINGSPRMRSLVNLALRARIVTSVPALRAYAATYDPSFWVAVARQSDPASAAVYRRIYYVLQDGSTTMSLRRIADRFSVDLGKFDRLLAQLDDAPPPQARHEARIDYHVLHAIRQALMMKTLSLAAHIPNLSGRHDASIQDLMQLAVEMRIGDLAAFLETAFPPSSPAVEALQEVSLGTRPASPQGYDQVHAEIITPLKTIDRIMHKLTLAISQGYRAWG